MTCDWLTDRLSSIRIPQAQRFVNTPRDNAAAIRAEGDTPNRALMSCDWLTDGFSGIRIPQP